MTSDTNIDTRLRKLEVEFLHGVPVKLPESAIAQIKQLIKEARINEVEQMKAAATMGVRGKLVLDYARERLAALQGEE